jgi:hypothetical protein
MQIEILLLPLQVGVLHHQIINGSLAFAFPALT